jgi:hypothetical protein
MRAITKLLAKRPLPVAEIDGEEVPSPFLSTPCDE